MFMLSTSSGLELWSINLTSLYEHSELKVFQKIKFFYEISSNWPNELLGPNVDKTLQSCWKSLLSILQWTNITSVIYKWDTFSLFLS